MRQIDDEETVFKCDYCGKIIRCEIECRYEFTAEQETICEDCIDEYIKDHRI